MAQALHEATRSLTDNQFNALLSADINRYIELWCNPRRLHSGLDDKTPQEALNRWTKSMQPRHPGQPPTTATTSRSQRHSGGTS